MMTNTPLSQTNQRLLDALTLAAGVIQQLDAQHIDVRDIDVRGGTPVLRVAKPPQFVRGVCRMRAPQGTGQVSIFAAPYHGAQLEWSEHVAARMAGVR